MACLYPAGRWEATSSERVLVSQGSLGPVSAAPRRDPVVPHPRDPAVFSSLSRSQSDWEGTEGIGITLSFDSVFQINDTSPDRGLSTV